MWFSPNKAHIFSQTENAFSVDSGHANLSYTTGLGGGWRECYNDWLAGFWTTVYSAEHSCSPNFAIDVSGKQIFDTQRFDLCGLLQVYKMMALRHVTTTIHHTCLVSKKKLFTVTSDDVCSVRVGGVRGDDVSTGPGSSLLGTMTVDGGSERRERATGLLGSGLLVPTRV